MARDKRSYAIALLALKVPPGCIWAAGRSGPGLPGPESPSAAPVEVFLRAGYAYAGSPQEVQERYLEFLREHLPARNGWACHSVSVEDLSEVNDLFDEMIGRLRRLERGLPLEPENSDDAEEDMPELPM